MLLCYRPSAALGTYKHRWRQHTQRTDVAELLKEGVVGPLGLQHEGVCSRTLPTLGLLGEVIPPVPVAGRERRCEHMVKVEFCSGTVPARAIMELDTCSNAAA